MVRPKLLSPFVVALVAFLSSITLTPKDGYSYSSNALGRFTSFELVIESLDPDSQTCGIQESAIRTAVEYPLVGTGLTIRSPADPSLPYLYVRVATMRAPGNTCITDYELSVRIYKPIEIIVGRSDSADVVLWSTGGMLKSGQSQHASDLSDDLRQEARKLVVSWNRARQTQMGSHMP
jgi:hypothetical protein